MPASKTQLIGGNFQDAEGNVLALGYLEMELSQDATVTGVGNVAAGITIRIQLDANGSVSTSPAQYVWGNDNLLPVNTFYRVTGYTVLGQPAWGPNNQQVIGASPFDVGTWVPNQVISWVPSVQAVTLETNGTPNASQVLLNFVNTASVTWANSGGNVSATAAGGGIGTLPWFIGPGVITNPGATLSAAVSVNSTANEIQVFMFALIAGITVGSVSVSFTNGLNQHAAFGVYSTAGNLLLDSGPISSASAIVQTVSITPVTLAAGTYYFAQTATNPGVEVQGLSAQAQHFLDIGNVTATRAATAANAYNGTNLPATLGALTALTISNYVGVAYPMFS